MEHHGLKPGDILLASEAEPGMLIEEDIPGGGRLYWSGATIANNPHLWRNETLRYVAPELPAYQPTPPWPENITVRLVDDITESVTLAAYIGGNQVGAVSKVRLREAINGV